MTRKGQLCFLHPYLFDSIEFSKKPQYFSKSFLHQKFIEEGLTYEEIASQIGCSRTTVKNYLKKFGISKNDEFHRGRKNLRYGKKIRNRQLEDHKRELNAIETIKKLYDEGLHPRAIARVLISMKIPTKKKGTWHHHVVITILKREGVYIEKSKKGRKS